MKLTPKQIGIIAAIVVVIFIAIGIYFYLKGKKTTTIAPLPTDQPDPNQPNNANGVGAGMISQIADSLYNDMKGWNWLGHDATPYKQLDSLSDTDFVAVYNDFNTKHQSESGETLVQWINGEQYAFADVQNSIRDRFGRLNLK